MINKIINQLPSLENKRVMIIGDIGLDEYVMGQVRRISPEAPVPVLDVESEDSRLGLSGNVAQNISSLGGYPILISVVGQDGGADSLRQLLNQNKVSSEFLVVDSKRPTTRKTRVMAQHHHLVRVDYELRHFLDEAISKKVIEQVKRAMDQTDIVILQDYAKGVISRNIIESVIQIAHAKNKKVLMDPHRANPAAFYEGVDLIKPNFAILSEAVSIFLANPFSVIGLISTSLISCHGILPLSKHRPNVQPSFRFL
jgi:rfaE bifunctional protein kinase chain/domain